MIQLDQDRCVQCGLCARTCAFGAVAWEDGYPRLGEACVVCGACVDACPTGALVREEHGCASGREDDRGFWVVGIEDDPERLSKVSQELLSEARRLADRRGSGVTLAVCAGQAHPAWREAAGRVGCEELLLLEGAGESYSADRYTAALAQAIEARRPEAVLFPATADGRDCAPRVACRLQTGLTADCTGLEIGEDGGLLQIRPTYGGSIMATICTPDRRPQMASVRPNVMKIQCVETPGAPTVSRLQVRPEPAFDRAKRIASALKHSAFGSLEDAAVVIAGGYGLGGKERFEQLYRLCGKLNAAVAATRKAVDEGWAPPEIQVGQTGKTVAPDLYLALGVSGALQHTLGMSRAKQIIAVNSDPAAPIFGVSDVAVLADAGEILELLLAEF